MRRKREEGRSKEKEEGKKRDLHISRSREIDFKKGGKGTLLKGMAFPINRSANYADLLLERNILSLPLSFNLSIR